MQYWARGQAAADTSQIQHCALPHAHFPGTAASPCSLQLSLLHSQGQSSNAPSRCWKLGLVPSSVHVMSIYLFCSTEFFLYIGSQYADQVGLEFTVA